MKILILLSLIFSMTALEAHGFTERWSLDQAKRWGESEGWVVGANYIPAGAVNQLEMWQTDTFDPEAIDRDLAFASGLGMNTMRVFLHDLVWRDDKEGFVERIDIFLQIAQRRGIKPMFVLFDSCWDPRPKSGIQPAPLLGVHNSRWVQSPGVEAILDPYQKARLENYVTGIISRFAEDSRILAWDLWNEPDGINTGYYGDPDTKLHAVEKLLPEVFEWARNAKPTQPLTSAVWTGDWSSQDVLRPTELIQLTLSDIVTFHNYDGPISFESRIRSLLWLGRPIICTEYMARTLGSTIQNILPITKRYGVGAINWGFVAGKTQTNYPWDSWLHPYPAPPALWFHDLLLADGTPFDAEETELIRALRKDIHVPPFYIRRSVSIWP